ncbi:xaa-Pro dipeptidase [Clostridium sp. CAG:356]|nr:xaa-Pro dipeptidase [Clostridium sp. CAG:356]
MEEFITILKNETAEIVEKKSKFIANLFHVESVEEAENRIKDVKKKYHDARHNCIAYRVVENGQIIEKSSDDGEPSGTAGGPMLNILQKNNLCNLVIVVTRYFGGILLGTGGLVRAYSEATQQAIEKSTKVIKVIGREMIIELDYSNLEKFKYYCKNNNINIKKIDYMGNIILKIEMEESVKEKIIDDIKNKKLNIQNFSEGERKCIDKFVENCK